MMKPTSWRGFGESVNPWSIPCIGDQHLGPAFGQEGYTGVIGTDPVAEGAHGEGA